MNVELNGGFGMISFLVLISKFLYKIFIPFYSTIYTNHIVTICFQSSLQVSFIKIDVIVDFGVLNVESGIPFLFLERTKVTREQ